MLLPYFDNFIVQRQKRVCDKFKNKVKLSKNGRSDNKDQKYRYADPRRGQNITLRWIQKRSRFIKKSFINFLPVVCFVSKIHCDILIRYFNRICADKSGCFCLDCYIYLLSMGGDESKPEGGQSVSVDEDNHFFVEEISKVSLKNRRQVSYYWIDPKVYNAENQKYYNQYLQNFKIDSFTYLDGLKSELEEIQNNELIKVITAASLPDDDYRHLQNEKKIAQVFLFCGNEERAKLLGKNFPKIKGYGLKCQQVIEVLKKCELEDHLDVPPCSLLTMLEEDRKMLNKYRLNYYCITTKHPRAASRDDFVNLARSLCPEQNDKINKFETQYSATIQGDQIHNLALSWAFDDSFYWKLIENLPKATVDPKKLAYLRFAFTDLYHAIFIKHKEMMKTQKIPDDLYIVVQLSPEEIEKIQEQELLNNFLIFTSFIKGYTKKADAIKEFKESDKSFLFEVNFSKRPRFDELDFGFYISEDKTLKKNVIFNIYNFFQLENLEVQKRSGSLFYGPLSEAYANRADKDSKKRLTENETILLRNFDYLQDLIKRDKSQAIILQMSGYFKESLEVYDRKVEHLKSINAPASLLNNYIILRGDAYRMNEDYEEAEKQYRSITDDVDKLVGYVHLLELYLKKGDDKRAQEIQRELDQSSNMRKLKERHPQEAFKAENYLALNLMKQNKHREALKKYKNLQNETSIYYNYRFEGIPLVHDIFRNMAACESKLNNHKQALNLLESTKDWQLVCEGTSAGLALTETMIHNVHEDMGNKESARETANNLTQLQQTIGLSEKRYLNQSLIAISMGLNQPRNVNNSGVNINMNPPSQNVNQSSVNVNLNPVNINQSAVNVNMNPVNVNQSAVNVNMNPVNVNQSMVNVNLNPAANINQSRVDIDTNQPVTNNYVINQSAIKVNVSDPKKPININHSSVDIQL